jgi:hypothetical protein
MSSVSGLSKAHRLEARSRATAAAWLAYNKRRYVHYTQSASRWEGIDKKLNAKRGQYPKHADCSSLATWCLWNGLYLPFHVRDTVNGAKWKAGYTGTMLKHGKEVEHLENVLRGDCVIYGGGTGKHTAIIVGVKNGKPMVISHGSEGGPYYLAYDYRSDVNEIRRFI